MDSKIPLKAQRDAMLKLLRQQAGQASVQANQASAWQKQLLELIEELNRDCLKLRVAYAKLLADVDALKQERSTV